MAYDDVGNPVAATDALGHVTVTEYDAETRTFPVRVRSAKTGAVEHVKADGGRRALRQALGHNRCERQPHRVCL